MTTELRAVDAVVIGASAGGVEALLTLFADVQPGFKLPIIVVLHVPDERRSQLAAVFNSRLSLPVKEVDDKEPIARLTTFLSLQLMCTNRVWLRYYSRVLIRTELRGCYRSSCKAA